MLHYRFLPLVVSLIVMFSLLSGCSGFRSVSEQSWPTSAIGMDAELAGLYEEISMRGAPSVTDMEGYADIWIETPERDERIYANVMLARGEAMRMIMSAGILGWPVADMQVTPDSLRVLDLVNNRLLVGTSDPPNMERVFGVAVGFDMFSEAFLGVVEIDEPLQAVSEVRSAGDVVSYRINGVDGDKVVLVDTLLRRISGFRLYSPDGRLKAEMHFREFGMPGKGRGDDELPYEIDMILYDGSAGMPRKHSMVVVFDELEVNRETMASGFSDPGDAPVFVLDRMGSLPWSGNK